jgi:hypothetical protein
MPEGEHGHCAVPSASTHVGWSGKSGRSIRTRVLLTFQAIDKDEGVVLNDP